MINVREILDLHRHTVALWHREAPSNPYDGFLHAVCQQHQFNFLLWHEEDIARSPNVGDARIAAVKRAIDRYNQQRNDWIEKLDVLLIEELASRRVTPRADARLNTETPGSAIDRLSIMSLRVYHLAEQIERADATDEHRQAAAAKLATCQTQLLDLSTSLVDLVEDIGRGRKQLKVYRQHKMYNDPAMNPFLYGASKVTPRVA